MIATDSKIAMNGRMEFRETQFVDINCKTTNLEFQMVEAVKLITTKLMNYKPLRGYSRKPESFRINCVYNCESDTLQVIGEIEHVQRGYTQEEKIQEMAEALRDWDRERERR